MKILVSDLRKIIREALLEEQRWVPGRWDPISGEPVDSEEFVTTCSVDELTEKDQELEEGKKKCSGCKGKKPGLWCNICRKRARGEKASKPGSKHYPKTLNVGESDDLKNQ